MKKSILNILFISFALLFSCTNKKETSNEPEIINTSLADGLPENKKSINGYFYSCLQTYMYSSSSPYYYSYSFAIFSDPSKNLINSFNHYTNNKNFSQSGIGNIDVGNVFLNNNNINKSFQSNFEVYYYQNLSGNSNFSNYTANWVSAGNKTFKPINVNINKGFPTITTNSIVIGNTVSKSSNYTINFGNNITNYDSLIVILEDGNFNSKIRKTLSNNATYVTFTSQEMNILATSSYGKVSIYAYNYSNITIDNKVNVFELSNQYIYNNIYITL